MSLQNKLRPVKVYIGYFLRFHSIIFYYFHNTNYPTTCHYNQDVWQGWRDQRHFSPCALRVPVDYDVTYQTIPGSTNSFFCGTWKICHHRREFNLSTNHSSADRILANFYNISLAVWAELTLDYSYNGVMMTSSNGNNVRVTGHLCGEFTGLRGFPVPKASDAELWCFFYLRLNKRLRKQSWGWWFEKQSRPLWRHCNGINLIIEFAVKHRPVILYAIVTLPVRPNYRLFINSFQKFHFDRLRLMECSIFLNMTIHSHSCFHVFLRKNIELLTIGSAFYKLVTYIYMVNEDHSFVKLNYLSIKPGIYITAHKCILINFDEHRVSFIPGDATDC